MSDERRPDERPPGERRPDEERLDLPRREVRRPSPSRRRIGVPWWGLTLAGAGAGLLMASWPGAILGGVLGFVAWKLR